MLFFAENEQDEIHQGRLVVDFKPSLAENYLVEKLIELVDHMVNLHPYLEGAPQTVRRIARFVQELDQERISNHYDSAGSVNRVLRQYGWGNADFSEILYLQPTPEDGHIQYEKLRPYIFDLDPYSFNYQRKRVNLLPRRVADSVETVVQGRRLCRYEA